LRSKLHGQVPDLTFLFVSHHMRTNGKRSPAFASKPVPTYCSLTGETIVSDSGDGDGPIEFVERGAAGTAS